MKSSVYLGMMRKGIRKTGFEIKTNLFSEYMRYLNNKYWIVSRERIHIFATNGNLMHKMKNTEKDKQVYKYVKRNNDWIVFISGRYHSFFRSLDRLILTFDQLINKLKPLFSCKIAEIAMKRSFLLA